MSLFSTAKKAVSSDEVMRANIALGGVVADKEVHPDDLELDPNQPRKLPKDYLQSEEFLSFKGSIRNDGVLMPVIVRPFRTDSLGKVTKYRVVSGERRVLACKEILREEHEAEHYNFSIMVPVIVRHLTDQETLKVQIVENEQRKDLSIIDKANGYIRYKKMMEKKSLVRVTWDDVATEFDMSIAQIQRVKKLLNLPEDVQEKIRTGELSARQGGAIATAASTPEEARRLASDAIRHKRGGDEIEERAKAAKADAQRLIGTDPQTPVQQSRGTVPTSLPPVTVTPPQERPPFAQRIEQEAKAVGDNLRETAQQSAPLEIPPKPDDVPIFDPLPLLISGTIEGLQTMQAEYEQSKDKDATLDQIATALENTAKGVRALREA